MRRIGWVEGGPGAMLDAILEAQDVAAYIRYNQKFHDLLYRGAKNPVLEEQVRALRRRLQPYRSFSFEFPNRMRESHAEHIADQRPHHAW